jgi:DNA-binding GntR family transcriptional regulator
MILKYQEGSSVSLVRNEVFEAVRGDILSCTIMPGAELREAELAERYGVSKSPIRDAMRKLEFEGLVEIESRRGHRVRPISVKDAEDILDLRIILDVGAVAKVVEIASDEELRALDRFSTADVSSKEAFSQYNSLFHTSIAQLTHNRRLFEESRRLMEFYRRLCIVSLSALESEGDIGEPLSDHIAIIAALQRRDAQIAADLVRRHVDKSRGQLLRSLKNRVLAT